jgi:hypothetical protein
VLLFAPVEALSSSSNGSGEPKPQPPKLLARFKVNAYDTLAVFMATTAEDFLDVASLLPPNTALPAADKMTYLIARLEVSRALAGEVESHQLQCICFESEALLTKRASDG